MRNAHDTELRHSKHGQTATECKRLVRSPRGYPGNCLIELSPVPTSLNHELTMLSELNRDRDQSSRICSSDKRHSWASLPVGSPAAALTGARPNLHTPALASRGPADRIYFASPALLEA